MEPPPLKKQKTDPNTPVIFNTTGGLEPDILINILGRDYHVHSTILKLHSAFFAAFLDFIDKDTARSGTAKNTKSSKFLYEWITRVGNDSEGHANGGWFLIEKPKIILKTLVELADYYLCLPILSQSINNALLNESSDKSFISHNPCQVMALASKIRHKLLFTEALIFVAGLVEWSSIPEFERMEDKRIKKAARTAHNALMAKIFHIQQVLADAVVNGFSSEKKQNKLRTCMSDNISSSLPQYYRNILSAGPWDSPDHEIDSKLEDILENKLPFPPKLNAGDDGYEENFFCVEIADEDLPWDVEESIW
ncbi:hypothetical protein ONS95_004706 [Cadophora gregata]|uniref:uncharacterized protein n=1 Tax=Cadophora gregata TaxID=51156 RepID=UPI0026DBBF2F|nr:uncharacterized protein ONS95_004706 [Cadophora gregata]KAK0104413.1 hypothetical protein ONS95_004706 [Cadophora gregata]